MTGAESPPELLDAYYDALDNHAYERLRGLLSPAFVHERPEMTLEGRDQFVSFMREQRPETATRHPIEAIYATLGDEDNSGYAARGRLVTEDGTLLTGFVDVFTLADGQIERLRTYTD